MLWPSRSLIQEFSVYHPNVRPLLSPKHNPMTVGQMATPTHHPDPFPETKHLAGVSPTKPKPGVVAATCIEPDHSLPKINGVVQGRIRATNSPPGTGNIVEIVEWAEDGGGKLHALIGAERLSIPACGQAPECFTEDAEQMCVCPLEHHYDAIIDYCVPGPGVEVVGLPTREVEVVSLPTREVETATLPIPGPEAVPLPIAPETPECCFRMGFDPESGTLVCPTLPAYDGQTVEVVDTFVYEENHPFAGQEGVRVQGGPLKAQAMVPVCEDVPTPEECPPGYILTDGGCISLEDVPPTPDPGCPEGHYLKDGKCVEMGPPAHEVPPDRLPPKLPDGMCLDVKTGRLSAPGTQLDGAAVQLMAYGTAPAGLTYGGKVIAIFTVNGHPCHARVCGTHGACCEMCAVGLPCTGCGGDGGCGCGDHGREENPREENPCEPCERVKAQLEALHSGRMMNPSHLCVRLNRGDATPAGTQVKMVDRGNGTKLVCAQEGYVLSTAALAPAVASFRDRYGRQIYVGRVRTMSLDLSVLQDMLRNDPYMAECTKGKLSLMGFCLKCRNDGLTLAQCRERARGRITAPTKPTPAPTTVGRYVVENPDAGRTMAGAAAGAALGSFLGPIGAAVGGVGGALLGKKGAA